MVTRKGILTLLGIAAVAPVRADGILEQMQTEVAKITTQTRPAVVAVEDERKNLSFQFFGQNTQPNETQTKRLQELQEQMAKFEGLVAQQDQKVAEARKLYESQRTKDALAELDRVTRARRELNRQHTMLKREASALDQLYRRQAVATLENSVITEQVNALTKELVDLQKELTEFKQRYANAHPKIKENLERTSFVKTQIDALKAQMAQVQAAPARQRLQAFNVLRANAGTGFSIGDGYILTTADVVEPMENPTVITDKGTRIKAKIVGVNGDLNIGLLKLQAQAELPALTLGDSQPVRPGHFALSIGNQTGDPNSVALNLVGGRREQGTTAGTRFYPSLIQIAGTVGAGTSGAPLMNAKGEVIGIVVAIPVSENFYSVSDTPRLFTPSVPPVAPAIREPKVKGQNQNQTGREFERYAEGFARAQTFSTLNRFSFNNQVGGQVVSSAGYALPINEIKAVIEQLKAGQVARGWIGIAPEDEDETVEDDGFINTKRQVRITGVFPESPALEAGIQVGDVLLRINDKPVRSSDDVRETSMRLRPGDTLTLRIIRFDKQPTEKTVELKISPRPMETKPAITTPSKKTDKTDKL